MLTPHLVCRGVRCKLNLLRDYFGAILIDRGDRISWTGDAHCSQAAALAAFGNDDFVKKNLDISANDSMASKAIPSIGF